MNLKSYVIRSSRGIFTVTNVQTEKKVVYRPKASYPDNRLGEIHYQGYGDSTKYQYAEDYSEVYQYVLVARHGSTEIILEVLVDERHGKFIQDYIWDCLQANPQHRMIDITGYTESAIRAKKELSKQFLE